MHHILRIVMLSGSSPNPAAFLTHAHAGYIADSGVTDVSGFADAIADGSGNGNTLTVLGASQRPAIVANWRNGRTALLGRSDAAIVCLTRTTHANGALAQPFTRYTVCSWSAVTAVTKYLVFGVTTRCDTASLLTSNFVNTFAGSNLSSASAPVAGTPCILRTVFDGATSTVRCEPNGAAVITASGAAGANSLNGLRLLGASVNTQNFQGHLAFHADIPGDLPADNATLDSGIMSALRSYYNIVHA